jgi:hypothetical protein
VTRRLHLALLLAVACGTDEPPPLPPAFPLDYADTYQEVRNCRFSLDHDLTRIRILASPDALAAYNNRTDPFPPGAIVLKEEYDGGDTTCSSTIFSYTVMVKTAAGAAPADLDWEWQEVDRDLHAVPDTNVLRCVQCHTDCGRAPEGYDGTCAVP